ncbi:MAG: hypothetical protein WBI05_04070 [Rhodoferax sp.]|uniref:hypothetical protein n=1 Tax=Rhodoferax sp. TaxID=50421 RepID=UPI003C778A1D
MTTLANRAQTPWPEHAAADKTHQRVLEMIRGLFLATAGRKALDVPCGAAARADLEIIDVAVNDIDHSWFSEMMRPWLTRRLPAAMQGEISFYGDVMIYGLRKKNTPTASCPPPSPTFTSAPPRQCPSRSLQPHLASPEPIRLQSFCSACRCRFPPQSTTCCCS